LNDCDLVTAVSTGTDDAPASIDRLQEKNAMLQQGPHRKSLMLAGAIFAALVVSACTPTTTLEQGWAAPVHPNQGPSLTRVVTVFVSDSATMRRATEDQLARDLIARGVTASPGYAVLTDSEIQGLKAQGQQHDVAMEELKSRLHGLGYDGLVTMRIVDRDKNLVSYGDWGYPGYWDGGWWGGGYYGYGGYTYTETTYRLETDAYSLPDGRLVWSGLLKSVDPSNAHQLITTSSSIVAKQLTRQNLAG
jgi:hypothetical protein